MSRQALFNLALKTFLFLSPIFFFRTYQLSFAQGMFFVFASFVLFGISLVLEPKRKFSNHWVALFLLWAFIRMFVGGNFGDVTQEWFNFWLSSAGFIYVFVGALLFYTIYCHAEDPKDYLKPILIVSIMNFILIIAQMTRHDFMWRHTPSLGGFIGISSQLGQYSAMSIPVLAFINPWLVIIPLFTLFATKSISPIVALCIGAIFVDWKVEIKRRIRILIWSFLGLTLCLGACNYKYVFQRWQCRPVMWEKTLRVALKRPYLGHGYRSFHDKVIGVKTIYSVGGLEYSRPHNDSLHTVQEMGFPAMIIIGGFFVGLWKKFKAKVNKDKLTYFLATSILIVIVNGCGQTLIRYASMAGTFIILLAFLHIKLEDSKNGDN